MLKKVYTHCVICKRELQDVNPVTGELTPTMSAYPYCGRCAMKSMYSKDFQAWAKKQVKIINEQTKCQE